MSSDRSSAERTDWPFLSCARCRDRIGIYEQLWWHLPDGSIVPSAFLPMSLAAYHLRLGSRFYHRECLAPARDAEDGESALDRCRR
jgi:hypothetical protein